MKKILFIACLFVGFASYGQTKGYFRYDSTQFEKGGGNNEIIILNGTRGVTGGVLTNTGNGRTAFVLPAKDSTFIKLKWFSVTDYGADTTGVADATTAIQSAYTAANGGGVVYFPKGTYKVSSTINIRYANIVTMGSGESSKVLAYGDYGNIFSVEPSSAVGVGVFTGVRFQDIYIETSTQRTSGYAIYSKYTSGMIVKDCRIGTIQYNGTSAVNLYNGIGFLEQSFFILTGTQVSARHHAVYINGQGGGTINALDWDGLITGNCNIFGDRNSGNWVAGNVGVYIAGGTGGIQIEQAAITYFENGIKIDRSYNGIENREVFLGHSFAADDCGGAGIYIGDTALISLQMNGGWAAGNGRGAMTPDNGIYVSDNNQQLSLNLEGGTIYYNEGVGLYMGSGVLKMNGTSMLANTGGVDITLGANVTAASITGCRLQGITSVNNLSSITPLIRANLGLDDLNIDYRGVLSNTNYKTNGYQVRNGNLLLQSAGNNNSYFNENGYYDSNIPSWTRLTAGYVNGLVFYGGSTLINGVNTGSGNFTPTYQLKSDYTGKFGLGASIAISLNDFSGSTFYHDAATSRTGIGVLPPTAILHLKAGTATANTAPLKITAGGVLNTTPEPGAIESDATKLYWVNDAGTRVDLTASTITNGSTAMSGFTDTYIPYNNGGTVGQYAVSGTGNVAMTKNATLNNPKFTSQALSDGATITWDSDNGTTATVTLGGNRTLSITNAVANTYYQLRVTQDGTGSRTLTLPAGSKVINGGSGAITLSTAASSIDILTCFYDGTNYFWNYGKNYN